MNSSGNQTSRKKMLLWAAAIFSSVTFLKIFSSKKTEKKETIKMLTRDGKLVEIDKDLLTASGQKISNEELQKWIQK